MTISCQSEQGASCREGCQNRPTAEGKAEIAAMRFAAAAAGLKCTRLGGSAGAPHRAEVDALLATP